MRAGLRQKQGQRETFTGVFVRLGKKRAFRGPDMTTILLRDIKGEAGQMDAAPTEKGKVIALWNGGSRIAKMGRTYVQSAILATSVLVPAV